MSGIKDVDPIYMDVVVQNEDDVDIDDDEGYCNKCLEISEFSVAATNRELVNLENAAVNIDNSNDVIIGPVTQFNVNGNVTVYQNKDGLPIGIERDQNISTDDGPRKNGFFKSIKLKDKLKTFLKYLKDFYRKIKKDLGKIFFCIILSTLAILLYVTIKVQQSSTEIEPKYGRHLGNQTIYYTSDWGGTIVDDIMEMPLPVGLVIVSHTATQTCYSLNQCAEILQSIQTYQMNSLGYQDICYNFLIGSDGNIYVGRGWDTRNCYLNKLSMAISFIGNFDRDIMTKSMKISFILLLEQGLNLIKLPNDYVIVGYNQTETSKSPGANVYRFIKDLPNYADIDLKQRYKGQCSIYEVRVGKTSMWTYPVANRTLYFPKIFGNIII